MQLRERLLFVSFMLGSHLPFKIRVFSKTSHTWSKTLIIEASASISANKTIKRRAEASAGDQQAESGRNQQTKTLIQRTSLVVQWLRLHLPV